MGFNCFGMRAAWTQFVNPSGAVATVSLSVQQPWLLSTCPRRLLSFDFGGRQQLEAISQKSSAQDAPKRRPCRFSTVEAGKKSRIQPARGQRKCCFCAAGVLDQHLQNSRGKGVVSSALLFFKEHDQQIYEDACDRIRTFAGQAVLDQCLGRLSRLRKRKGVTKAARARNARQKREQRERAARVARSDQWRSLLVHRLVQCQASDADHAEYQSAVAVARRKLAGKFPSIYPEGEEASTAAEWRGTLAEGFRKWARFGSWSMCSDCHRMQPQKFWPTHVRQPDKPMPPPSKCKYCKKGIGYWAPTPEEIPAPLRNLPSCAVEALSIFDIYAGPAERAHGGYWVHTGPIRFSWKVDSVEDRLVRLPKRAWKKARKAYRYLIDETSGSAYNQFLTSHASFLRRRQRDIESGDAEVFDAIPWLPMNLMETVGLECAVWPHLYWCTDIVRNLHPQSRLAPARPGCTAAGNARRQLRRGRVGGGREPAGAVGTPELQGQLSRQSLFFCDRLRCGLEAGPIRLRLVALE